MAVKTVYVCGICDAQFDSPTTLIRCAVDDCRHGGGFHCRTCFLKNLTLDDVQQHAAAWERRWFGDRTDAQRVTKLMEEVGELSHAVVRGEYRNTDRAVYDAIGDIIFVLMHIAAARHWPIDQIIRWCASIVCAREFPVQRYSGVKPSDQCRLCGWPRAHSNHQYDGNALGQGHDFEPVER